MADRERGQYRERRSLLARVPKANQSRRDAATITLFGGGGVVPVWSFPAFSAARPSTRTRYHGMYRCGIATQLAPADDVPVHPYAVALESAHLAPNAQVSIYPWKANPEQIQLALRHVRAFLKANRPASATQQPLAAAAQ